VNAIEAYRRLLQTRGASLQQRFGISEVALAKEDALSALQLLSEAEFGVLGGDVYFKRGDAIELAYANWHCDPNAGESSGDFRRRSIKVAEDYIKRFPVREGVVPLFVLVAASFVS
jgi:hypothetical protein